MATPLSIKIFKGEALVGTRDFNLDIIKIGRLSAANLCLDDDKVSRIHSVIDTTSGGSVSILDMGSAEGTWVNGKRVNKGVLTAGDEIRLGNTRLVLAFPQDGALATAPAPTVPAPDASEVPTLTLGGDILADMRSSADQAISQQPAPAPVMPAPAPVEALSAAPAPVVVEAAVPAAAAPRAAPPVAAPAPRPRAARRVVPEEGGEDGVEVRVFWGDTLLGSTCQVHPKAITLGDTSKCDFQVPGQGLPAEEFPIVEAAGSELQLVFDASMDGEVQQPGAEPRRLRDIEGAPHALQGCRAVTLESGSFAWVSLSTLRVEVEIKPIPRRVFAPFWAGLDYRYLNLLLVFGFATMAFIITAAMTPLDTDTVADDLYRNPTAMAKFIVKPPPKTKNPWAEKLKGESAKAKGEPAEKHKGEEGAMGKKGAPKRNTRSAPKAVDVNAKDLVKNSGLMRLLGGGGGGLSTILGTGGLGGDLKGAIGHMFGPAVGDAAGLSGLGLRGTGVGGGGFGNTIGIGDIGTKGRGGGLGGYGSGIGGMGRKGGSDVAISSGNPIVEGSLDKELIRRVIHQHRAQVRFCYESELVRHQGLAGKVTVKFIISANGSVQRASVDNSTLGNANVENCIVSRVYQWEFPKPKGGGIVVVNYPFLLKESGE